MRTLQKITKSIIQARSDNADFDTVIKPLYEERVAIIDHKRQEYEDREYAVDIDCPIHITHTAKLYVSGHRQAGMWECKVENITESCTHYDLDVAEDEDAEGHTYHYYACVKCNVEVQGDPDADSRE
jgi:hypothetical protein